MRMWHIDCVKDEGGGAWTWTLCHHATRVSQGRTVDIMSRACTTTTTDKKMFALFIVWIVCDESSSEADEEASAVTGRHLSTMHHNDGESHNVCLAHIQVTLC